MTGGEEVALYIDHGVRDEAQATLMVPDEAQATLKDMKERMIKTRSLEDSHGVAIAQSKIHRFPRGLRGIGGSDERYIVPTVVAIGPYHHGQPHLQDMEVVKLAAANRFFKDSSGSVEDVYGKLLSVVGKVRDCYDDDDDKDVMLLEKQIPWLVLDTLMDFLRSANVGLRNFVAYLGHEFFPKEYKVGWWSRILTIVCGCATGHRGNITKLKRDNNGGHSYESYRPAHLLGLLRFSQIWQMPEEEMNYAAANTLMTSSSAVELAQIGVKLTASTAAWFGDMRVQKSALFGEFFAVAGVPERRDRLLAGEHGSPGGGDRVGERHRRARDDGLLQTHLGQHLSLGARYFVVLEQLEAYRPWNRPMRSFLNKLIYNSFKAFTIASLASIVGVLVGIFKTLLSKKQN
uniref:Uncharacterized protein n=1 Tax=Oryza nivara TaxID=4536 RepID=A0A0E0I6R3_ORYNI